MVSTEWAKLEREGAWMVHEKGETIFRANTCDIYFSKRTNQARKGAELNIKESNKYKANE